MRSKFRLFAMFAALIFLPTWLRGAVSLSADLSLIEVRPGEQFEMTLFLHVTAGEEVAAVSYYWSSEPGASGWFRLVDRTSEESPVDLLFFETPEILEEPLLNPRNALDLGGIVSGIPLGNGEWLVARYVFSVSENAVAGHYEIMTTVSPPGTGWVSPPPDAQDIPFTNSATFMVSIVPEPSFMLLMGLSLLLGMARKVWSGKCGDSREFVS